MTFKLVNRTAWISFTAINGILIVNAEQQNELWGFW